MTCRIFVEAASDAALLHTLLADLDPDPSRLFRVIAAGGANAARPMARTAQLTSDDAVILVTNAATTDHEAALARKQELTDYLAWGARNRSFLLVQFVPEIDVVFFDIPGLLERVVGSSLDPLLLRLGRKAPRDALDVLNIPTYKLLLKLDQEALLQLRAHPLLTEIRHFILINAAEQAGNAQCRDACFT